MPIPPPDDKKIRAAKLGWARRNRTQFTGAKNDHMCMYCGYIYDGPHTGERLVGQKPTKVREFKGVGVSHGACDPPCEANEVERYMRTRRGKGHK